jgi:D-alanyl-D-alanine carboxypeptidase
MRNRKTAFLALLLILSLLTGCGTETVSSAQSSASAQDSTWGQTAEAQTETQEPQASEEPSPEPEEETPWNLILVNRWNPLPEDYTLETTELSNGTLVDTRIYPYLQEMFDAAREAGVYPVVASGYRTTEDQERIMSEYIQDYLDQGYSQEDAQTEAEKWVAIPGTSEHQLGLGVDINADGVNSAGYEVYDWLEAHCWEYGFILRYPEDKTDITGISNEPWHFRYVGQEAAEYIMSNGLCLEEYLEEIGS